MLGGRLGERFGGRFGEMKIVHLLLPSPDDYEGLVNPESVVFNGTNAPN